VGTELRGLQHPMGSDGLFEVLSFSQSDPRHAFNTQVWPSSTLWRLHAERAAGLPDRRNGDCVLDANGRFGVDGGRDW